jgi:hypothetical protein
MIGIVTAGVLVLLVLDRLALTPLLDRRAAASEEMAKTQVDYAKAESLRDNGPRMKARWNDMLTAGLKSDVTDAESQALRALHDWAEESGLATSSLQPDRVDRSRQLKDFQQITLRLSGTGPLRAMSRLLWHIQTARIPLRVTDLQVNARKDGGVDDLTMSLAVSTLVLSPTPPAKGQPAPTAKTNDGGVQ